MADAIVVHSFGAPGVLVMQEQRALPALGPTQVLIDVLCAGVNPVDTYMRAGTYGTLPALPYTPGFDACGVIRAIGSEVHRPDLRVGQRVWCWRSVTGTYASRAICEMHTVAPAPASMSDEAVASVGVGCMTASLALFEHAKVQPGETVFVHGGSGSVGLACVQFARGAGCAVVASAGSGDGLAALHECGAHAMVDHSQPGYVNKMLLGRAHAGFDVIIEMLANVNLPADTQLLAPRGRIVVVGNRGEVQFNARSLMAKDATLIGMSLMNASHEATARSMWRINAALENGTLKPRVHAVLPLREASKAHEVVMTNGKVGKVVLRVG